ncbi:MAG: YdeI/OmpD-associated family protein [Chitinophagaceae bacterium]|nr:YdeI/OmpD-associated family protein [Chitinophagaceae bacterium]MDP1765079.1 YdeI/OmpD-associated family protein [Sediminibacterium sp.]MDP1810286.1 YdeI/OmpD-associated family protein [Sediminibacterium sp.]MDP3128777.1 YdeI/OmpD-associated family protein [Sediminibacterium sp.]MDP3667523.1 YdeI/OmpD-associated family protein [Sediminibacterium sp.]
MSNPTLLEKLQLKDEKNLLIQGLPSSIEKQFAKINYAKNVTPLLKAKKLDFALVFALSQNQLNNVLNEVFPALHDDTKLWVAYPKTASKIVSDLNRDCSWELLKRKEYECVRQVTLDHVWTAMRFKKLDKIPNRTRAFSTELKAGEINSIDFEKKLVVPPVELGRLFTKHKDAQEFFSSLSFTNQKEYVSWIEAAKKEETRKRRLETALEKLLAGKKNPSEK